MLSGNTCRVVALLVSASCGLLVALFVPSEVNHVDVVPAGQPVVSAAMHLYGCGPRSSEPCMARGVAAVSGGLAPALRAVTDRNRSTASGAAVSKYSFSEAR